MKRTLLSVGLSAGALLLIFVLALPASAEGLLQSTPTPAPRRGAPSETPSGGLAIPTATPAELAIPTATSGGLAIPTATSAGLAIPTATPGSVAVLPALSESELESLNLQPGDIPAPFSENQQIETYPVAEAVTGLRESAPDIADQLQGISDQYGWTTSVAAIYAACDPSLPITAFSSEIIQLGSPELARQAIEDDNVQSFFENIGFDVDVAQPDLFHGWTMIAEDAGECFAQETEYTAVVEYWGLLISVSVKANSETDVDLVSGLIEQLLPVMLQKVDALAETPLPPTPTGAPAIEEEVTDEPAVTTVPPTNAPPPTQAASDISLSDIEAVMPTQEDLALPAPPFQLNQEQSSTLSLDELVADYNNQGLTELANAFSNAGSANGMVGVVSRVWDTGISCPATVGLSVGVDVGLFASPEQAQAYVADEGVRQAWMNTGLFSRYDISGDVSTAEGFTGGHQCGEVTLDAKSVATGRLVVTVLVIGNPEASHDDLLSVVNLLSDYMVQQLSLAGLN